jgi:hypothetical protein
MKHPIPMTELQNLLFRVQPFPTVKEATKRITEILGFPITEERISHAINYNRKIATIDPDYLGWMFPHVDSIKNPNKDFRFYAVLIDSKGDHYHNGDIRRESSMKGFINRLKMWNQSMRNKIATLEIELEYEPSPIAKRRITRWMETVKFALKQGEYLLEEISPDIIELDL